MPRSATTGDRAMTAAERQAHQRAKRKQQWEAMRQNDQIVGAIMGELAHSKAAIEDSRAYRGGTVASGNKVVEHALRHGRLRVLLEAMGDGLNAMGLHRLSEDAT